MANFSKECIETFLNKQLQLFDEKVAETPQEAEEFLEDNLAVVLDSIEDVRDYLDESGMDAAQLSKDEILQAIEHIEDFRKQGALFGKGNSTKQFLEIVHD